MENQVICILFVSAFNRNDSIWLPQNLGSDNFCGRIDLNAIQFKKFKHISYGFSLIWTENN